MYERAISTGGMQEKLDYDSRVLAIQSAAEEAGMTSDQVGLVSTVLGFLANEIPFEESTARVGNVPIEGEGRWYDNIFAGERSREEAGRLFSMSRAEFNETLPRVMEDVSRNSKTVLFGVKNDWQAQMLANELINPSEAWVTNSINATQNVPLIGSLVWKGGKTLRTIPGMLRGTGSVKEAADITARAALLAEREGAEAATSDRDWETESR